MKKLLNRIISPILVAVVVAAFAACGESTAPGSTSASAPQDATSTSRSESESTSPSSLPPPEASAVNTLGNTTGNLKCYGIASAQGNWLYYANGTAIWKREVGSKESQKLCDAVEYGGTAFLTHSVNVVGDWVYFTNSGLIQKVRTDGTDFQTFDNDASQACPFVSDIYVLGDWLYYIRYPHDLFGATELPIMKCRTDGTEETTLGNSASTITVTEDGWIYFTQPDSGLYRMQTDGTQQEPVSASAAGRPIAVVDGWAYFSTFDDFMQTETCGRIRTDGTEQQPIAIEGAKEINVAEDGWIYYYMHNDGLYKAKADGTESQRIMESGSIWNINIVGDTVFFNVFVGDEIVVGEIGTDGSDR